MGATTRYEAVIGLEVHAQLLSRTKLFCWASTTYGAPRNTQISPVSLGLPGALPVPNREAVRLAVRACVGLGLRVHKVSRFDRKHYFYPDLPKGYQISQLHQPLAEHGELRIEVDGESRAIGITRIHMEEDAAKNVHTTDGGSMVDFNRAGVPLIEVVSEPDLRSPSEAEAYLRELRGILMCLGVNDGDMEKGSFRCDANVSIRPVGQRELGTRVELKNINSFRFVKRALEFEIARQQALLAGRTQVVRETRTWNEDRGKTLSMRSKEEEHDYRYFPDPDLPALVLEGDLDPDVIRSQLPELPAAKRTRYQREWTLSAYDAGIATSSAYMPLFFEGVTRGLAARASIPEAKAAKHSINFIQAELLAHMGPENFSDDGVRNKLAEDVTVLLSEVEAGRISGKMAKDVFARMAKTGRSPKTIIEEEDLSQLSDSDAIEREVRSVMDAHPEQVAQYRAGKTKVAGFFVGQIMKATRGRANPNIVNETLKRLLEGSE